VRIDPAFAMGAGGQEQVGIQGYGVRCMLAWLLGETIVTLRPAPPPRQRYIQSNMTMRRRKIAERKARSGSAVVNIPFVADPFAGYRARDQKGAA
jgi:hypothetical protein